MPLKKDLGNALWLILHSTAQIANNISDSERRQEFIDCYQKMETNLAPILPCPQCQGHYQENKKTPEYQNQSSPEHLNRLNYLHNQVNKMFNRPIFDFNQSIELTDQLNTQNPNLLKLQYLKAILTLAQYWNQFFWNRPKKRFKHNVPNLKSFLTHSLKLLSLAEPEEVQEYWEKTERPFQKSQLYQFLSTLDLPTNRVPENFSFDFKGCGCLNK